MRNVSRPYGPIYGPALAALLLLAVPAFAQTLTDTSGSASNSAAGANANNRTNAAGAVAGTMVNAPITSRSGARSTSTSGSTSNAQSGTSRVRSSQAVNVNVSNSAGYAGDPAAATDPAGDPSGAALGSAGNPITSNSNLSGTQTLRNTPEIVAPNIAGGNPCLVGVSGGGAGPGIGITLGIGYSDRGCERRNSAALLSNIGERDVAIELMCDDDNVREAMRRTGHPCAADRPAVATVSTVDPAVIRRQQDAAQAAPQLVAAKPARPDWCETASPAELRSHRDCD